MRRALAILALTATFAIGGCGDESSGERAPAFDLQGALEDLRGAPADLAGLHAQANRLLGGGPEAFRRRLAALEGTPVVINKWASWCGPCKSEFPYFQQEAAARGREVAFLGLNAGDKPAAAREFLAEFPVPFPSYEDPDEDIASKYRASKFYPVTIFVDRTGEIAAVHPGEYRSREDLARDIERYL